MATKSENDIEEIRQWFIDNPELNQEVIDRIYNKYDIILQLLRLGLGKQWVTDEYSYDELYALLHENLSNLEIVLGQKEYKEKGQPVTKKQAYQTLQKIIVKYLNPDM